MMGSDSGPKAALPPIRVPGSTLPTLLPVPSPTPTRGIKP
jgi:hypothetical protein